eukprot:11953614-Ditylum_brightwellii.AAC.1
MLLHAKRHLPEYITTMLWLYALKMVEIHSNRFDIDEDGMLPEEKFTGINSIPTLNNQHMWGCLVYVLGAQLQDCLGTAPKCAPGACLGIYLGPSSVHARNVHLV